MAKISTTSKNPIRTTPSTQAPPSPTTTTSATTKVQTTTSTSTQAPITTPTTTTPAPTTTSQAPTTTSTTTQAPTSSTTTKAPTTQTMTQVPATTPKPISSTSMAPKTTPPQIVAITATSTQILTTMQAPPTTSTQAPTTTSTTTQAPTTTSTTTQAPTSSTTTKAPTTQTTTQVPTTTPKPIYKCPTGFVLQGDSCYMYVIGHENRQTHTDASRSCLHRHSHLVIIDSEEEQKMIENYLNNNRVFHNGSNVCVAVLGRKDYQWRDFWCADKFPYICETPATVEVPTTHNVLSQSTSTPITAKATPSKTGSCPHGWLLHDDSCYLYVLNHRLTHADASSQCQRQQSHLVIIDSQGEQHMIAHYLNRNGAFRHILNESNDYHSTTIWTAGLKVNNRFQWLDTTTNTYKDIVLYHHNHWEDSFPYYSSDSGTCIGVIGSHRYKWRDFRCEDKFFYICEKPAYLQNDTSCVQAGGALDGNEAVVPVLNVKTEIGYVKDSPGYLSFESCPGFPQGSDLATTSKITMPATPSTQLPPSSATQSTTTTTQAPPPTTTSTTTPAPTTTSATTKAPTTTLTTTQAPTTTSTTTQAPTTTSTTTQAPTTTSTTTKAPTTTSTTTQAPTTTSTTTQAPTTTSTTTQAPTTASTTTQAPTTTSTTTQAPTTTSTTIQEPTTTSTTTKALTTTSATTQAPTTTSTTTQAPTTTSTTTLAPTTTSTTTLAPTTPTTTLAPTTSTTTPGPTTTPKPIDKCPTRFELHGDTCYMCVFEKEIHAEASKQCENRHSHLIIIDSEEEQKMMENYLNANREFQQILHDRHDFHDTAIWTGGVKLNDQWKWSNTMTHTNTDIQSQYTHWRNEFPYHSDDDGSDVCVAAIGSRDYKWRDFWCDDEFYYICETPASVDVPTTYNLLSLSTSIPSNVPLTTTRTTPPQTEPCPNEWFLHHDSCYLFVLNHELDYEDASSRCQDQQSHLIIINDEDEQNMLVNYLDGNDEFQHILGHSDDFHSSTIWTAGIKVHHRFQWLDPLTNTYMDIDHNYNRWDHGFPYHSSDYDTCIGVIGSHHYKWRDFRCFDKFFYICEKPALHRVQLIG
ncbi:carbohydrate binding [Mactra antiquata]